MNINPFLTQFKVKRTIEFPYTEILMKYDDSLDYNVFLTKDNSALSSMTKTAVKTEKPDEIISDLSYSHYSNSYLQTKTMTEVKPEQPDEVDEMMMSLMMSTQTFTKVANETTDQDIS